METIRTTDPQRCQQYADECLSPASGHEGKLVYISTEPCVLTGPASPYRASACQKHGFYVARGQYLGGSIVTMTGDVSICLTTWGNTNYAPELVHAFAEWLKSREYNVTRDNNDVLVDNKKILSWGRATTVNGWCQSVVHFSVGHMDLGLVEEICLKPMVKIPGALDDYGITTETIIQWLEDNKFI